MVRVTRRYRFEAAHRLVTSQLSDEQNEQIYGKCARVGGHGHNYEVDVTLEGQPDPRSGMLMPRAEMDELVKTHLIDKVDHRNLNDVFDQVTTGENLALLFQAMLAPAFVQGEGQPRLARVRVYETARNVFDTLEG